MKLYLRLEDGDYKVERVIEIKNKESAMVEDSILESMIESIEKVKEEDEVLEAQRITQHND